MSNWVDDFNSFQGSQSTGVAAPSSNAKKPPTKKESIEAELKLLEWHKMANDAAMKAALVQTMSLKEQPSERVKQIPNFKVDDARWMRKVINEENAKPLEVSRDFVMDYERKEKENSEKLATQVERHIHTLRNLRGKLEQRADLKSRTEDYRNWEKDFIPKKEAVFEGKTIDEYQRLKEQTSAQPGQSQPALVVKKGPSSDLSHVLDSLSRLSELENRISKLETGNVYDNLVAAEENPRLPNYDLDFKKKRTLQPNDKTSMRVVYSIQQGKKNPPPGTMARGGGIAAIRQQRDNDGGGIFLTGVAEENSVDDRRERIRREKQMRLAQASNGQKSLRNRVLAKKTRGKVQSMGERKHEEAMLELQRRKQQLNSRKDVKPAANPIRAAKGASSGVHTRNKHLQDFENMKSGFDKRKDAAAMAGVAKRKTGQPGIGGRVASKTAPGANEDGSRKMQQNPRGIPATKTIGTVTRKIEGGGMPTRRPPRFPESQVPDTAPPAVSVSGIRGIRSIRQQK